LLPSTHGLSTGRLRQHHRLLWRHAQLRSVRGRVYAGDHLSAGPELRHRTGWLRRHAQLRYLPQRSDVQRGGMLRKRLCAADHVPAGPDLRHRARRLRRQGQLRNVSQRPDLHSGCVLRGSLRAGEDLSVRTRLRHRVGRLRRDVVLRKLPLRASLCRRRVQAGAMHAGNELSGRARLRHRTGWLRRHAQLRLVPGRPDLLQRHLRGLELGPRPLRSVQQRLRSARHLLLPGSLLPSTHGLSTGRLRQYHRLLWRHAQLRSMLGPHPGFATPLHPATDAGMRRRRKGWRGVHHGAGLHTLKLDARCAHKLRPGAAESLRSRPRFGPATKV
jgi:hypothetical protein